MHCYALVSDDEALTTDRCYGGSCMADQNSSKRFEETPGGQTLTPTGRRRSRSRVYGAGAGAPGMAAPGDAQGDLMQTEPYLTPDLNRGTAAGGGMSGSATSQMSRHGEGAESTGNSVRGMLSAGVSGATTTRGGQQGGIGASVFDAEPGMDDGAGSDDSERRNEEDLTLGEQFGGAMEPPDGSVSRGDR